MSEHKTKVEAKKSQTLSKEFDSAYVSPLDQLVRSFVPVGYENLDFEGYDFDRCITRLDHMGPYDEEDVVAALLRAKGAMGVAAGLLGRSRSGLKKYLGANPSLMAIVVDFRETCLDVAEISAMDSALNGDSADRRFLLQTLGKTRGYSSRVESTGADGGPVEGKFEIVFVKSSDVKKDPV